MAAGGKRTSADVVYNILKCVRSIACLDVELIQSDPVDPALLSHARKETEVRCTVRECLRINYTRLDLIPFLEAYSFQQQLDESFDMKKSLPARRVPRKIGHDADEDEDEPRSALAETTPAKGM